MMDITWIFYDAALLLRISDRAFLSCKHLKSRFGADQLVWRRAGPPGFDS
jgi:hypothetical protein